MPSSSRSRRKPANVGVGLPEGGVALPERPHRAGQPVGLGAVGRVRQLLGRRAGVQPAVRLHPEHDVAGVAAAGGLEVAHRTEQVERLVPAAGVAGLLPVPQVDDGRAGDVVGVEGALPPGAVGLQAAAADALVRPVGLPVGVGPQHTQRPARGWYVVWPAWSGGVTWSPRKSRCARLVSGVAAVAVVAPGPATTRAASRASTTATEVRRTVIAVSRSVGAGRCWSSAGRCSRCRRGCGLGGQVRSRRATPIRESAMP